MKSRITRIITNLIWLLATGYWLLTTSSFSQNPVKIKKTIRAEALLPRPVSNKAFTKIFSGVFDFNASVNFGMKNFNAGPCYNILQGQIFPKFQDEPHSIQTVHTAGIRLSYDVEPRETPATGNFFVFSPFIAPGYNWVEYSRLQSKNGQESTGKHTQAFNVFWGANFNLFFSEWDALGFTIGYNILNHRFNPDALLLNQYYDFTEDEKKGIMQYLLFGFNVHVDLAKRPKQ